MRKMYIFYFAKKQKGKALELFKATVKWQIVWIIRQTLNLKKNQDT